LRVKVKVKVKTIVNLKPFEKVPHLSFPKVEQVLEKVPKMIKSGPRKAGCLKTQCKCTGIVEVFISELFPSC
jgi:hypothetical protein